MPSTLDLDQQTVAIPQGRRLFSSTFGQKAPYHPVGRQQRRRLDRMTDQ